MNKQELDEKIKIIVCINTSLNKANITENNCQYGQWDCIHKKKCWEKVEHITQACAKHFLERIVKDATDCDCGDGSFKVVPLDLVRKIFDSTTQDKK